MKLQSIKNELTEEKDVSPFILRLDLIDPITGGNKLFKLKYNLEEAKKIGHKTILTFGGAWSNHLAAVASSLELVVNSQEMKVIAIVRGEEPKELSATLKFCKEKGVCLHFISREEYRKRSDTEYIEQLRQKFGDFYLLPEGGSNTLAVKGCKEILDYIDIDFDYICCPVGSGGTLAGIVSGLKENQQAMGFAALNGKEYLNDEVTNLVHTQFSILHSKFCIIDDYTFGGYAKTKPELLSFKKQFEEEQGFALDYVYTSKMMFGIFDLMRKDYFKKGSTIVAVHTGGLQGNAGFEK